MKEELVSLEVAKLLKEKGFGYDIVNDPTNKYGFHESYCLRQFPTYSCSPSGEIRFDVIQNNSTAFKDLLYDYTEDGNEYGHHEYLAPTQSLAQKWLREKHNIHVGIDYDMNGWSYYYLTDLNHPTEEVNWSGNFKTYEETLEEGLKQGLMLIK